MKFFEAKRRPDFEISMDGESFHKSAEHCYPNEDSLYGCSRFFNVFPKEVSHPLGM